MPVDPSLEVYLFPTFVSRVSEFCNTSKRSSSFWVIAGIANVPAKTTSDRQNAIVSPYDLKIVINF